MAMATGLSLQAPLLSFISHPSPSTKSSYCLPISPNPNSPKLSFSSSLQNLEMRRMTNLCNRGRSNFINFAMSDSATPICMKWCIDTGATRHMSPNNDQFENKRPLSKPFKVELPDGTQGTGSEVGDVSIGPDLVLKDVVYVPQLEEPLLSVSYLNQTTDLLVWLDNNKCQLLDSRSGKVIYLGVRETKSLYYVNTLEINRLHQKVEIDVVQWWNASDSTPGDIHWIVDARSTIHATGNDELLEGIRRSASPETFIDKNWSPLWTISKTIYDSERMPAMTEWGDFRLGRGGISLKDVRHLPGYQMNTLSVGRLCEDHNNLAFFFVRQDCYLVDKSAKDDKVIAIARKNDHGHYVFNCRRQEGSSGEA